MRQSIVLLGLVLAVAGCSEAESPAANATNTAAAEKPRPKYCFFKDAETKGWSAARGKDGNVTVKGKAYRSDPRYQAQLAVAEVSASKATLRPSIAPNATGYASPGNWWDVSTAIPNSAAVDTVVVECGPKTLAELKLPPAKTP